MPGRFAFRGRHDEEYSRQPTAQEQLAGLDLFAPLTWPERPAVTAAEQRSLPIESSIDADYKKWREEEGGNAIFDRIRKRALAMYHAGAPRIGVKALCERERWENKIHLDNRFTSRIARDLIEEHKFLGRIIQLRQLDSSEGVSE